MSDPQDEEVAAVPGAVPANSVPPGPIPPTPDAVQRWEDAGGTWQVDLLGPTLVRILLCRCDGGEVADVIETADPAAVRWAQAQAN